MFTQTELDRLIDAMRANGVSSLEVEAQDQQLHLDLAPAPFPEVPLPTVAPVSARVVPAKSPCIGRFVPRGIDDGLMHLESAQKVEAGETLGYVVQQHARAVVTAPAAGTLIGDAPQSGTIFGYGDTIIRLEVIS